MSHPHLNTICFSLWRQCRSTVGNRTEVNRSCATEAFDKCHRFNTTVVTADLSTTSSPAVSDDYSLQIALLVLFILISVFSLASNFFVCLVYALNKEIRTSKHYLIVNLAVADILVASLAIPFFLTSFFSEVAGTLCQIGSVVDVLSCTSSIVGFAVISLERFLAVRYPLRYAVIVSRKRCQWAVAFVWFYAITIALLSCVPIGDFYLDECVFFTKSYLIIVSLSSFLLPLLAMLVFYGWIFKVARYQAAQINGSIPRGLDAARNNIKREFKAAKTLTLIIGTYVVCWLPFFAYIWIVILPAVPVVLSTEIFDAINVIRYLNCLANPFVYVGINRDFRRCSLKVLKKWSTRARNDSDTESTSQSTTVTALKPLESPLSRQSLNKLDKASQSSI